MKDGEVSDEELVEMNLQGVKMGTRVWNDDLEEVSCKEEEEGRR